ncbi:MAG: hypothetical protein QOE61_7068, partial [Micromonosporaceae bacterium]|nr:hypothetical protein [Micromonosporaceae bacterium]
MWRARSKGRAGLVVAAPAQRIKPAGQAKSGAPIVACAAERNRKVAYGHSKKSTEDQHLDLQRTRLKEGGCGKLFEEKISGAARQRPALERLLQELRADDILVVTRLDRLARSTA